MRLQMKQIWIIVLFLLTAAMMFRTSAPAYAAISASYLDYDESGKVTEKNRTDCVEITSGTRSLADGWYVVKGDVTIEDRITIDGTDVKIIILDDSTSAVDTDTDHRIQLALKEKLGGMTTIIIAQRVNSVKEADKIIIMNDGRIEDIGNHKELMGRNEVYRDLYNTQMEGALE